MPLWADAFFTHMSLRGIVSGSCDAAGVARRTAYDQRENNPEFAKRWGEAEAKATERLEAEAWRRATEGREEPVFWQGERVDTVMKYSNTLMIFLLKAHNPEKYRERYDIRADVTVRGGEYIKDLHTLAKGAANAEPASDS